MPKMVDRGVNSDSGKKKTMGPGVVKQTPMLRQYLETKEKYPDCILFFRLGDFYEMFFEDAEVASEILDITLTARTKGEDSYPMCGVPYFSAKGYIRKLIEHGLKVAVCDQVEDAKQAKGIVKREVTRVVSPGMITEPEDLDARESNYLGGLTVQAETGPFGFAYLDVSTAEFQMTVLDSAEALLDELARVRPRELLCDSTLEGSELHKELEKRRKGLFIKFLDHTENKAEIDESHERELFGGTDESTPSVTAARMVFNYAQSSLPGSLEHVRRLTPYRIADHMIIDEYSRANLELTRTLMEGRRQGTLLGILDRTRTPMGARMMGQWLLFPLVSSAEINRRLDAVEQLLGEQVQRSDLAGYLSGIKDMERLLAKVSVGQANPRDLGVLRDSWAKLPGLSKLIQAGKAALPGLIGEVDLLADLYKDLDEALVPEPPLDVIEGGVVRSGYNQDLDHYVNLATSGREFIARLEQDERKKTGIGSLKIRYNKVFGYYIEVTKPNLHLVPENYRRKQTTANAERYETDELKQQEESILRAQQDRVDLERKIVGELTAKVQAASDRILKVARQVAMSDVLVTLAELASTSGYCRPKVDGGESIEIVDGRHPVVEKVLTGERFVPNDVRVDCQNEQILLITGPNMAGKSTTIRQVALIAILAQMGSFVPAKSAKIGIVDRIFTRIGAADNLARGQSTFMVEMVETSHILKNATRQSLLILDEIGRGTSTFDGLSIAWATAEYIHDRIGARTLFATHYHQLTDLALTKDRVGNYTISVKEWKEQIVFLRRLVKGVCNRSYGIQVGRLAGLPEEVVKRAREVLANLEGGEYDEVGSPRLSRSGRAGKPAAGQLQLFTSPQRTPPESGSTMPELDQLDLDTISPLEALQILHKLKGDK